MADSGAYAHTLPGARIAHPGTVEVLVDVLITRVDPRAPDVRRLLEAHLAFARAVTPPGHVHALDLAGLEHPSVTVYGARQDGRVRGIGALRRLDDEHAELKSMHTSDDARGQGVGTAMARFLLDEARAAGLRRVSLETGTDDAFTPARSMYTSLGFVPCPPFGDYVANEHSICMTIQL